MRLPIFLALALAMSPAHASTNQGEPSLRGPDPVDWLYPEMPIDDEGWRSLLPVILLDIEALVEKPVSESARHRPK